MPAKNHATILRNIRSKPMSKWSPREYEIAAREFAQECGWHQMVAKYNEAQMATYEEDRLNRKHIMRNVWRVMNRRESPPSCRLEQRAFRYALLGAGWTCDAAGWWTPPWYTRAPRQS